jgi:hypothetical protein
VGYFSGSASVTSTAPVALFAPGGGGMLVQASTATVTIGGPGITAGGGPLIAQTPGSTVVPAASGHAADADDRLWAIASAGTVSVFWLATN